ncbi:hypothetical protein ACIBTP_41770 [Streptomyces avidinii]|uniref:hypothetical protein n=1 Tax=Streptomyces avidinii TaxID=1895 RepID=UPI0037B83765
MVPTAPVRALISFGSTVRDVLDTASLSPWSRPQWDRTDPEGEDVRRASIGALTDVYWVNRNLGHLRVLTIVWAG